MGVLRAVPEVDERRAKAVGDWEERSGGYETKGATELVGTSSEMRTLVLTAI